MKEMQIKRNTHVFEKYILHDCKEWFILVFFKKEKKKNTFVPLCYDEMNDF